VKFFLNAAIPAAIMVTVVLLNWSSACADETKWVSYEPAVVTFVGVIVEEAYDEDAAPMDRGKHAWILRLDHPVSVRAKDEIDTEERNVSEVHLNLDQSKHPGVTFGKTRVAATGALYHAHTGHHLRPTVMLVSELKPAGAKE